MLVIDKATVERVLTMPAAIAAMREAFAADGVHMPVRSIVNPPALGGLTALMPAHVPGTGYGLKVVSVFEGNHAHGLDPHQGFVALIDSDTGVLQAIVDGASITAIRTAAVSALATDLLARKDAAVVAIIGAGVQARTHIEAMRCVRDVRSVRVWSRTPERARALGVDVAASAEEAVRGADIVCTVTSSTEPVLRGAWLEPGAHVNAVGAFRPDTRELDTETIVRGTVFVDSREAAMVEAGEILLPIGEGAIGSSHVAAELGDVVRGTHPGRTSEHEVTVFKSLGLAMEDVASVAFVEQAARAAGLGTEVAFP